MSRREPIGLAELKLLHELLKGLAERGAALPARRAGQLFHVSERSVRRWVSRGKVERLPGGWVTARSLVDLLLREYIPSDRRNLFLE